MSPVRIIHLGDKPLQIFRSFDPLKGNRENGIHNAYLPGIQNQVFILCLSILRVGKRSRADLSCTSS